MVSLLSWVLFPLVGCLTAAGAGLLAGRLARAPLPPALLLPVGWCVGVTVMLPVYKLGGSVYIAAPLLVVLAVAGFAVTRGDWRERLPSGWPLAAACAAYALFMAPVILSGSWTWLGYNFVNDTAVNMVMTDHVATHGVRLSADAVSSTTAIINGTLATRYPMGLHSHLASVHGVVGFLPLEAVYQPYIAFLAALAAMAFAALAGRAGLPGAAAAAVGFVAVAANLTFHYAAHGAFKEVALVLVVAAGAAMCRVVLDARMLLGAVAQLGIVFAAGIVIFSTAAGAYVGVLVIVLAAEAVVGSRRPSFARLARAAAAGAAATVVGALAGLADALAFGRGASEFYAAEGGLQGPNSTAFLGHLLEPLSVQQAIGIWPTSDYRVGPEGVAAALLAVLTVLVVALAAVTALTEIRRRRLAALIALVPCAAVYLIGVWRLGPYAEAKLLVLLAPAVVFACGLGVWHLARRLPVAGAVAGALVAGGVLYSDALAYHSVRLAPTDRLEALADATSRAPQRGMILLPEWEEYAKYVAADDRVNVGPEAFSPRSLWLREYFGFSGHSADLDQVVLQYAEEFPAIVLRRSPDASRPPGNFRLIYRNEHYETWERRPSPLVLDHIPVRPAGRAAGPAPCWEVRELVARTRPGERILVMPRTLLSRLDYTRRPPAGWVRGYVPDTLVPGAPGRVEGRVRLDSGRYLVWLRGSTGRKVTISVAGRKVGDVGSVNTPEQWLRAGELTVTRAGVQTVSLVRPGGSLAPGDGFAGELGALAFEPIDEPVRPIAMDPATAQRRLCDGMVVDWVERVR